MTSEQFPKYQNLLVSTFHLGSIGALVITLRGIVCTEMSREAVRPLINSSHHTLHRHACSIQFSRARSHLGVMHPAVYRERDRHSHH